MESLTLDLFLKTSVNSIKARQNVWGLLLLFLLGSVHLRYVCILNAVILRWKFQICQTCYLTQSQYTDTRPTSPSTDATLPGVWMGSHCSTNCLVTSMDQSHGRWPKLSVTNLMSSKTDASDGFYRSIGQIPSPMKNYTEEQKSNPSPPKSNEGVGDG